MNNNHHENPWTRRVLPLQGMGHVPQVAHVPELMRGDFSTILHALTDDGPLSQVPTNQQLLYAQ